MTDLLSVVALDTGDRSFRRRIALLDRVVADVAVAVIRLLVGQNDRIGFVRVSDFGVGRPACGLNIDLRVALAAGLDGFRFRLLQQGRRQYLFALGSFEHAFERGLRLIRVVALGAADDGFAVGAVVFQLVRVVREEYGLAALSSRFGILAENDFFRLNLAAQRGDKCGCVT